MSDQENFLPVPVPSPGRASILRQLCWPIVILALLLSFWQWFETRSALARMEQEVAQSLKASGERTAAARAEAGRLQEQVQAMSLQFQGLEARVAEFHGQAAALQTLYQELARSRDDAILLEIEQAVNLAAQQLHLAGNVQVAVLSLQTADAKLSVLNRPQFLPLRRALGRDLDRLRALPMTDKPGISLKLENVVAMVDSLPLLMDARPGAAIKPPAPADRQRPASWWQRTGEEVWREIKGLVRIQRFDGKEQALLAPGQEFFLRDNLKLRLLNARLALLSHDQWLFRKDVKTAYQWMGRHFDGRDKRVQMVQTTLQQLAGAEIVIELPNLNESLAALRLLKMPKEKK